MDQNERLKVYCSRVEDGTNFDAEGKLMARQLDWKCILITGGTQWIGLECVRAYVREGARVTIADLARERAAEVVNKLGPNVISGAAMIRKEILSKLQLRRSSQSSKNSTLFTTMQESVFRRSLFTWRKKTSGSD
jgi:hypothetical protein